MTPALVLPVLLAMSISCIRQQPPKFPEPSVFPIWSADQLPWGPQTLQLALTSGPSASAILIAPGYLIAPVSGMGITARSFDADPTVYIYDGAKWHKGRYVDRDTGTQLALIRADVPGIPLPLLRTDQKIAFIVHVLAVKSSLVRRTDNAIACTSAAHWEDLIKRNDQPRHWAVCVVGAGFIVGAAFLDENGRLAGVHVKDLDPPYHIGPAASDIREFLDIYFSSWGRGLKKPSF